MLTGPGGVWGRTWPGIATNYLAAAGGDETARAIGISVRPRVRLAASRTHLFAKVQSDVSFAGRWLVLQRRTGRVGGSDGCSSARARAGCFGLHDAKPPPSTASI